MKERDARSRHDPYAALRFRDYRLLTVGSFIATLGEQMLAVAIGWEIYIRTHSALALGIVGLVQVLPVFLLSLPAGQTADRFDRKRIVMVCEVLLCGASGGLALLSASRGSIPLIYLCLLLIGASAAFNNPAASAMIPEVVPQDAFVNAASWSSSAGDLATVAGPALGGVLIAFQGSATIVYLLNAAACLLFVALLSGIHGRRVEREREAVSLRSLLAGLSFLRHTRIILAAITLDLFAVLLGGAVTLLPIYALDILHVGASGLGVMRTAPAIGAILMAIVQTRLPPFKKAGRVLLWAVAGFGVATLVFGVSRSFLVSVLALVALGVCDNLSVVIRHTLLLTRVPDAMLGRIAAVNNVFIGGSNELGGFESGVVAALIGPVLAVVTGGLGTLLVVGAVAAVWPELRRLGSLTEGDDARTEAAASDVPPGEVSVPETIA